MRSSITWIKFRFKLKNSNQYSIHITLLLLDSVHFNVHKFKLSTKGYSDRAIKEYEMKWCFYVSVKKEKNLKLQCQENINKDDCWCFAISNDQCLFLKIENETKKIIATKCHGFSSQCSAFYHHNNGQGAIKPTRCKQPSSGSGWWLEDCDILTSYNFPSSYSIHHYTTWSASGCSI